MKIVQINAVAKYSSTGRIVSVMHDYFVAKGHESYIAACNVEDDGFYIKAANQREVKLHGLFSRIYGRQGFFSKKSTTRLVEKLRDISPDVVHLHNLHANYINLPILLEYLAKNDIPTVITLHDCWLFTGHCCYFVDSGCQKWKNECGNCPDRHKWNKSWFFDCSRKDLLAKKELFSAIPRLAVVGVSDWVTSFLKDSILKDAKIIKRIYNWIDTDLFSPRDVSRLRKELGLENKFVVLGVSQSWALEKGLNDFIALADRLPEVQILMVGNMPEDVKLPQNILSIPATSSIDTLVDYYNLGDVFFNPSTRETFGLVTAEALSCGTPVIGYNATATPELVKPQCGKIVEVGDIDEVIRLLKIIKTNGMQFNECRHFVTNNFLEQDRIEEYFNLYKELENISRI